MQENKEKILSVKDLVISFKTDRGIVHAVRGVSFDLYKGETLCIVGESGSGKSVTNKAIMGISAANAIIENGQIIYHGEDLVRVSEEEFHRIRGHKIGMIFQDPLSALNPTMKIGKQITEATLINRNVLKRYYEELISPELTALRNVEADCNFEINKFQGEIRKNLDCIDRIKKLEKNIKTNDKKVLKLSNFKDSKDAKKKEKYDSYVKYGLTLNTELNSIYEEIHSSFDIIERNLNDEIIRYQKSLVKIDEKIETIKKNGNDLIKLNIQENKKNRYKEKLSIYSELIKKDYNNDEYIKLLISRNLDLKKLIKVFKKNEKDAMPMLKADLNRSKKKAKIDTNEYHKKLIDNHNSEIKELEEQLNNNSKEIESLRTQLDADELKRIDGIIAHNEEVFKKISKQLGKFKEISVSKTKKDNSLEILKTNNAAYDELLKEKDEINAKLKKSNENFINSTKITKAEAKREALEVMKEVGIPLPERRFKQYPFEFSGGMRQRIVIAIALTANPEILICDEPTTALDVTIQAQILELINKLKRERNLSCIFITHDLGVVANMADRVAVMYAGKIVEYGLANEVFFDPRHPYTWALLSSIPDVDSKEKLEAIPGTPPDMIYPPKGDAFALRSKYAMAIDFKYEPPFFKISDTHFAATWLLYPGAPKVEMPRIAKIRIENALKDKIIKEAN